MTHSVEHTSVDLTEYGKLSLAEVVDRIATESDRRALHEFHHNRPIFRAKGGPPVLFATFVTTVLHSRAGGRALPAVLTDQAYDLTVDKFLLLPAENGRETAGPLKHAPIDCRYYFGMLSRAVQAWRNGHETATELAVETAAARIVQRHVVRHCWLSVLEAKRRRRTGRSRYCWQLAAGSITVWMPQWLSGRSRKAWLEANIPSPDPTRPNEKERVQTLIDEHLGATRCRAFDERRHYPSTATNMEAQLEMAVEEEMVSRGLASFVADEKALRMTEQRPAIRRLGVEGLRALVYRAFDNLTSGCDNDGAVAQAFGLSKATFSRFAGQRWATNGQHPPDLWLNVARALACFAPFRDVARAAGVSKSVTSLIETHGTWDGHDE